MKNRLLILLPVSLLAMAGLTGCSSPEPRAYSVAVEVDKPLVGTSLQVDIIGARKDADLPFWENLSVSDYWQPENSRRRDANKVTLIFDREQPKRAILPLKDVHWKQWLDSGAHSLVILADIPGVVAPPSGSIDPRRLILPLETGTWDDENEDVIEVLVQESTLRVLTKRKK
jgi:hypothetical protein